MDDFMCAYDVKESTIRTLIADTVPQIADTTSRYGHSSKKAAP